MEVVRPVERLVDFLTEGHEILCPSPTRPKVGILGIELEPKMVNQAVEHRIDHVIHLYKETAVNADMIHHPPTEGFVNPPVGHYIQLFHTCS